MTRLTRRSKPTTTPKPTTRPLCERTMCSRRLLGYYTYVRLSTAWLETFRCTWAITFRQPVDRATVLTTVDQPGDLEAYIYIPTDRAAQARAGLGVELYDTGGNLLEKSRIDFLSPQVDPTLQGILAKVPVHATPEIMRHAQLIKAKVIWETKPMAVVPVLAVTRRGVQSFVYVARQQGDGKFMAAEVPVTLGDTIGNAYSITSGLNAGDKVIVSSTQFLVNGMPVVPLPG